MDVTMRQLVVPLAAAAGMAAALFALRSFLFITARRLAQRTATTIDDVTIASLRTPSVYWVLAVAVYAGLELSELPPRYVDYLLKAIYVVLVISVTATAANLFGALFKGHIQRSGLPIPATGLVHAALKGVIYAVGVMVALNLVGVSIAPLITALGVGGLAVALAVQDTLSNLFAGINILMERSIRVGDFIRLESGQEGHVTDITWRTTRIRTLSNNVVILPNNKLSGSVITNYSLPDKRIVCSITVPVSVSSDVDGVERVLAEEAARAVDQVPGVVADPEPSVRLAPGFSEGALEFTVACHVREFVDRYAAEHELRKRIFRRLRKEGIEFPQPRTAVYLKEKKEGRE